MTPRRFALAVLLALGASIALHAQWREDARALGLHVDPDRGRITLLQSLPDRYQICVDGAAIRCVTVGDLRRGDR